MTHKELLRVQNLKTHFHTPEGLIKAVDGVTFQILEGSTLGLVGESGCGKTTLALSILNLIPDAVQGEIWYKGVNLRQLSQEEMRKYRGREIAMIFQNPIPALNPLEHIGFQVGEAVQAHERTKWDKLQQMVYEYLGKVEIKDVKKRYRQDPHEFSGGEGQRIMLAMALIAGPSLLIADEPVKSLDTLVKRQVIELLKQTKKEFGLSMLLIAHDFAVVAEMSDYVASMYAGKIMEHSDVVSIYRDPRHPYTRGLLASIPRIDIKREIHGLLGEPPNPLVHIPGCKFHPRCPHAIDRCRREEPPLTEVKKEHLSACFRSNELPEWQN